MRMLQGAGDMVQAGRDKGGTKTVNRGGGGGGGKKTPPKKDEKKDDAIPEGQAVPEAVMTHIMTGQDSGKSHVGYHSQKEVQPSEFVRTHNADGNGVFAGKAKLRSNTEFKGSTFFPSSWTRERIAAEVLHAYFHGRTHGNGTTWAGASTVPNLLIGGLGRAQDKDKRTNISGIVTAFPAYDGRFLTKEEAETLNDEGEGKKGKKR